MQSIRTITQVTKLIRRRIVESDDNTSLTFNFQGMNNYLVVELERILVDVELLLLLVSVVVVDWAVVEVDWRFCEVISDVCFVEIISLVINWLEIICELNE